MQQSWREDHDKLTFILCCGTEDELGPIRLGHHDQPIRMLGDVNFFLTSSVETQGFSVVGEIELMVAVKNMQGNGYGRAALVVFLSYIAIHEQEILAEYTTGVTKTSSRAIEAMQVTTLRLDVLRVRINQSNDRSIKLFESVGFRKYTTEANYFGEFELRMPVDDLKSRTDELLKLHSPDEVRKRHREHHMLVKNSIDNYREIPTISVDRSDSESWD